MSTSVPVTFPCLLQQFFVQRLMQQRQASPNTVSAYRDTFRLLLTFAHRRLGKHPSELTMDDLNATLVLDFLHYLEEERHNSVRSRNGDPVVHGVRVLSGAFGPCHRAVRARHPHEAF